MSCDCWCDTKAWSGCYRDARWNGVGRRHLGSPQSQAGNIGKPGHRPLGQRLNTRQSQGPSYLRPQLVSVLHQCCGLLRSCSPTHNLFLRLKCKINFYKPFSVYFIMHLVSNAWHTLQQDLQASNKNSGVHKQARRQSRMRLQGPNCQILQIMIC